MATKIEWTDKTWQPMHGCTKVSEACQNCYAEVMARRLQGNHIKSYEDGFKPTLNPDALAEPYKWKKPCMVFVCSMGDLFHRDVPFEYIDRVMKVIEDCPQHTFQLLTKRAYRMFDYFCNWREKEIPQNVWLGVTCEKGKHKERIDLLTLIDAPVRFLSCEPLLDDMADINLDGIDWLITGGESGMCARRTNPQWFRNLREACRRWNVSFFFKQWGTWGEDGIRRSKKENGCLLDGEEWKQMPKGYAND